MTNLISTLLLPLIVTIGLFVLIGLGKVDAAVALPIIVGLTGVHIGANISSPTTVVTPSDDKPTTTTTTMG